VRLGTIPTVRESITFRFLTQIKNDDCTDYTESEISLAGRYVRLEFVRLTHNGGTFRCTHANQILQKIEGGPSRNALNRRLPFPAAGT
jgi:hypothetical protein